MSDFKKKVLKIFGFLVLILGLILGPYLYFRHRTNLAHQKEIEKRVVKVIRSDVRKELTLTGKVLPSSSIAVYSPVSGQIKEFFAQEGIFVKRNAPLFSVFQDSSGQSGLESAENDAKRTYLEMKVAEEALERRASVKDLFSEAENQRLEDESERRALEYQVAKQKLGLLRETLGLGDENAQNGSDTSNPNSVDRGKPKKGTKDKKWESVIFVRSPKGGIITFVNKTVGESVLATTENADAVGREVLTISDTETMMVRSRILEADLASVKLGMKASMKLDAFRGKEYPGVVSRISQQGIEDKSAGYTYFVTDVVFDKPDLNVRSQMNASILLLLEEKKNVLTLPAIAVATLNGHSVVEVAPTETNMTENKQKYRPITIGLATENLTEITDPSVKEGDAFLEIDFSKLDLKRLSDGKLGTDDKTAKR